jgi:hypothetical protein
MKIWKLSRKEEKISGQEHKKDRDTEQLGY